MAYVGTKQHKESTTSFKSQLTYQEIVTFLDAHWTTTYSNVMQQLNKALNNIMQKQSTITIAGTSGKSTTIHFINKLLNEEGLTVGSLQSPHFKSYNERISINNQQVSNQEFSQLANQVISTINMFKIPASSKEILTAMAFLYFEQKKIDVVVLEQETMSSSDPITLCKSSIIGITRIVQHKHENLTHTIDTLMHQVKNNTTIISAEQSKLHLQAVKAKVTQYGGIWAMPIRKTAPLPYPYEQLHGRCAALAERIAQTYVEQFINKNSVSIQESFLRAPKKQRGRPTLASKKENTHVKKTITSFWQETKTDILCRFQLIPTKHSTILLDNANSIDALSNLFLGIRLLHYQNPLKTLHFIVGCHKDQIPEEAFIKSFRHFFKKNSGKIAFVPTTSTIGEQTGTSWDIARITNLAQNAKIKAHSYPKIQTALETIGKSTFDQNDLIVITGSQSLITDYWNYQATLKNS